MFQKPIFFFLLVAAFVVAVSLPADAIKLTVKRVVFEGSKRAEVITVINSSNRETTYRVGWRHFVMTPDRALNAVPENDLPPEVKKASDMVRFAPRRFTLPPKSSQQVRLILRMKSETPDGEYRSHLWIRPEESVEKLKFQEEMRETNKRLGRTSGVSMRMLTGLTMPIIVRKGPLSAQVEVAGLTATETPGFIDVSYSLLRSGDRSVYGSLEYICNQGASREYVLRTTKGIAVYAESLRRDFSFRVPKGTDKPGCDTISLLYYEIGSVDGEPERLLAQDTVSVM